MGGSSGAGVLAVSGGHLRGILGGYVLGELIADIESDAADQGRLVAKLWGGRLTDAERKAAMVELYSISRRIVADLGRLEDILEPAVDLGA